jgi:pimeloyl-ACP methyl ester carboxylesterase
MIARAGAELPPAPNRYLVILGGMLSGAEATRESFVPIIEALRQPGGSFPASRILFYSYRGEWASDCQIPPDIFCRPVYSVRDTRNSVATNFPTLNRLVHTILDQDPGAAVDMVGYSLGGVVVLSWLGTAPEDGGAEDELIQRVRSVTLLDSPVRGFSEFANWRNWKRRLIESDLLGDAVRDLEPNSPIIRAIPNALNRPWHGVYAIENSSDSIVNGEILTGSRGLVGMSRTCIRDLGLVLPERLREDPWVAVTKTHGVVLKDALAIGQLVAYLEGETGPCEAL